MCEFAASPFAYGGLSACEFSSLAPAALSLVIETVLSTHLEK